MSCECTFSGLHSWVLKGVCPERRRHYGGGGITATIYWSAATATTGTCIWDLAWERHEDDAFDIDADGFAAAQSVTDSATSPSGEIFYAEITFTDGGQMDSIAVGEQGRLRLIRDAVTDTMAGDAELHRIEIRET